MATNKGYSVQDFEKWRNGGKSGGSSQAATTTGTSEITQSQTSNKYSMQSFEEWRQKRDTDTSDWLNRYNQVMQGVSTYDKKRNGGYTRDASGGFASEIDALLSEYEGIQQYETTRKYFDSLTELKTSIGAINESFSQFEDESAFDQYMAYWKDQEEKKNLDLDAYSREIATLEQQLEDYDPQIDWTDTNQRKQYDAGLKELEDEINRRKQYLAQAQRIQKKDAFSSVADPESERYDAAFDSKSGYVSTEQDGKLQRMMSQYSMGYDDLTYEYINNQNGIRDTIKQKAGAYKKGETPFEAKGYDYMTEDEVGLYNYYYSMGGKKSAEAYLDTIQEDLNQRKAAGMYQQMEGKTGAELVFGVEAGLDQFKGGIKGAVRAVKGDDSYVAPSATQYASGMVREDLADDGFKLPSWLGGASVGQVGYDAITTSANMAPSIAVGMLNPTMGAAAMGVSAGGSAYQEALNEGYSVDQARGYGILSGASEIVMEKVLGGISAYGGNALGKFFTQNMKNADTALKRIAKELGGSMLSEFSEEYLQEVLTPVFKNLTLGTDEEVKLVSAEALYAGFLGAITGGIMEGPQAIANARNATELANNSTPELSNATAVGEKSTPSGVTEESSAVDNKISATESTVTKSSGKNESSSVKVGVSKMETVQQTADIESFAQQFGTQANAVRRNYMEGQDLQEYELGFEAAYTMGRDGGKAESLNNSTLPGLKYLSQSQREIAFSLGRDAAAAQKAAETKAATAKAPTTKASLGQTAQLVAEDGSNSGTVTIAEIVSMDNSGMTLRLEDGRTVTDEDLDFPEGAEVYSTVMELGMDAESANAIVKASAAASIPRTAVAEGIETAYHYGRYGYGMDALLKAKEAAEIPESILQESYRAGEKRRQQSRETAQANGNRIDRKADEPERKGKVHFHGETDALNDVQRESLRGLEWIADLTGAQIHVEDMGDSEGLSRVNGLYDPADDSIHIDLRAGSDGNGTLLYTAAHEFVHRMRQNNEAAFYRLADFLVEQYGKKGISTDALVKQQMADAAADGVELNYDEAFEEMVADAMEAMFTDTDALAKMEKLKTQDKSLWQEIKDFVLGLVEKIKGAYDRLKPDSAEARYVLQMKESIDQIAQLFAEGVMAEGTEPSDRTNTKVKYSFAGRGASTADRSALQQAETLALQGVDNETIRQQTGWYKGMDGQWRYEIDDSQMEISNDIINYMQLGELIQHEKLFAAYPDLTDISVVFQGLEAGVNGSYHPQFDSINLSYRLKNDPVGLKDALVHEIQHAIQHREGFTNGATAASWERKIKAGFDSRRAADIRKAQETERELRRIQEEDPEFYRDMVELDAMTPDLPRGEIDWETLEKIEDDPVEWQQYDARREELEAKYGDTKVWDMNDLLYQREQAAKNVGRSGVELYFDTAGEIEARDASNRRSKSPEQRKTSPPRLGNEDTVFADGNGPSADYVGKTADGVEVYETSEKTRNLTWAERKKAFLHLMRQQYRGRTAKFIRNGHAYYAKFEYRDVSKNIYGDDKSDSKGRDAKINVGADGNIFELVENSNYSRSETERGKTQRMHRGVNHWDYFVKTVQIDGTVFDLTANVRKKADGEFVYIIEMMENNEIEPSSPQDSQNSGRNGVPNSSIISISNADGEVKQKFSRRKQTEADRMQIDQQHLAAAQKGDMKTAQKMVDEAAKQWGAFLNNSEANEVFPQTGEVRTFYHGTNTGDFTVFDKGLLGNSSGDLGWFGKGFYFAFSADEARTYGGRVIQAYLKMKNPYDYSQLYKFKGSDRGSSQYARFAWLYNIVKQFPDVVTDQKVYAYPNDAEEGKVVSWKQLVRWMDRIEKDAKFSVAQVELSNGDTAWELRANPKQESFTNADGETFTWTEYGMRQLFATEMDAKEPINQIGAYLVNVMGVKPVYRRAIENIDFSGAVQKAGYDGILQSPSGDEAVVFDPSQIKLSDPVTYDDSGNIIPLSKRFDNNHSDIRYSRRKQSETEALQEQNAKLQEDVTRLKELVKLQGKVTGGKVMKPSSVEAAAKYLKKLFHTDGNTKELAQKLNVLYEYIASDPELTWEGVKEQAAPIVQWLQDNEKFQRDQYAQDVLDTLKGQTFRLDETQLGEVNSQYGSLKAYRKAVKNMASSKAAQSLDQLWQELSSHYPDIFPPDTSASDMPLMFADALERLEGVESTEFAMDWRMKDQAMLEAVYDSYWRVSGLETVADKYSKKIFEIRGKHYEKMTELRKDRDQKLKELRESKKQSVQTVRDNRDRADLRRKIQKHAKAMSQKLLKPSDNAHVPEELKHTVAQVLNAINMESQYTLDPETGKRKKAPDGLPVERTKAFLKLQQQCSAIIESGGSIIIDPEMADQLADVLEWSDTPLTDMTKEQLTTVWKVIRSVEHSISTAGKMLSKARWESVDGFAGALEQTAQSRGKRKQLTDQNIGLDMETPITFFSHFGEAGEEMFRMLRDAQDKEQVLQDLMGAEARKLATAKQIEQLESQVHQFTVDGQTLYLNTAQIMELYVLTKQEDARSHLLSENNGKGIVQPNVEGKLDAGGKKKKVKVREGEQAVRMNAGELGTIIGSLSKEQRALADGIQKLTDLLATEGNKASMQVYGYQKFTGKDYWPIRSSSLQLKEGVDKRLTPKRSVKNMSSAKNRQENAKNALTVPGIFDTFSRHCKEMTEYAAYLAVMEDMDRLYNYQYSEKTTNEQGEEVWKLTNKAAKGYLKQLAGTGADRYWMNLMEDLQNGIGSNSVWGYGTVGKAKAAAVSGNIRVILQQFTAFPRAAVCMKTSDLLYGMTHSKGAWKRALQHSPTAMRKDAGTFDIGNAKQMKELLFDIHSGLDKANDALAKGAGWADAVTWGWLWRAAEHQAAKKLETGTDAYWQEVNRIFTQVIDESQVIDGILQRSQYMRNPDGISKMQTAFMGEPTMALNLVLRSYDSWAYETDENKRTEAGKRLARAASGVVLANVLAAIAQSIPDAWRDDDEDKTYWERFAKALTGYDPEAEGWQQVKGIVLEGNLVSSLNPLGWVPWIKDVLSLIQGFDVSRADTDLIKDLVTAATNITNKDSTKTTAYRVKELVEVGVKLLGNGMSNILRDVYGFTHSLMVEARNAAGLYTVNALVHEPLANKGRYMDLLYRAIGWGDTGGYDYVKQQLLTDGYTDGDIRDAMEERIKADYKEGTIDRETAYDRLVKYACDPELDAEEAENELWFQLEAIDGKTAHQAENGNSDGYSYSRYDKVYAAVRGDGNFQEAVKEMTDHGYEQETVIGEVRSQIGKWQRDGEISEEEAEKMLTTYGDMETKDAKARTKVWTWMKQNPKSQATVEQVEAYLRPLEGLNRSASDLGIEMDVYLKEKATVAAFKSDKDEYGNSITYSRIKKAFPYIKRLSLSPQQKTALAVACGWSYDTVMENKQW